VPGTGTGTYGYAEDSFSNAVLNRRFAAL